MEFTGFEQQDFDTFLIDGLDARMSTIQSRIQPKFKAIGEEMTDHLSGQVGSEMYLHIAKHARRTVNPPNDTWMAIAGNKRGYKKHPHFQVGLWDDHVFIWLAFIYELPDKKSIAENFIQHQELIQQLPKDFVVSTDHMKNKSTTLGDTDIGKTLTRFRDVKKAELLIGKHLTPDNPITQNGGKFITFTRETYNALVPLYRLAYQ